MDTKYIILLGAATAAVVLYYWWNRQPEFYNPINSYIRRDMTGCERGCSSQFEMCQGPQGNYGFQPEPRYEKYDCLVQMQMCKQKCDMNPFITS